MSVGPRAIPGWPKASRGWRGARPAEGAAAPSAPPPGFAGSVGQFDIFPAEDVVGLFDDLFGGTGGCGFGCGFFHALLLEVHVNAAAIGGGEGRVPAGRFSVPAASDASCFSWRRPLRSRRRFPRRKAWRPARRPGRDFRPPARPRPCGTRRWDRGRRWAEGRAPRPGAAGAEAVEGAD